MELNVNPLTAKTMTLEEVKTYLSNRKPGIATITYFSEPAKGLKKVTKRQYQIKINPKNRKCYVEPAIKRASNKSTHYIIPNALCYCDNTKCYSIVVCPFNSKAKPVTKFYYQGKEISKEEARAMYSDYQEPKVMKKIYAEHIYEMI